jgi:hypothetical protein
MKNYYSGDVWKFPFKCHGWLKFLLTFGGISNKYKKKVALMYLSL